MHIYISPKEREEGGFKQSFNHAKSRVCHVCWKGILAASLMEGSHLTKERCAIHSSMSPKHTLLVNACVLHFGRGGCYNVSWSPRARGSGWESGLSNFLSKLNPPTCPSKPLLCPRSRVHKCNKGNATKFGEKCQYVALPIQTNQLQYMISGAIVISSWDYLRKMFPALSPPCEFQTWPGCWWKHLSCHILTSIYNHIYIYIFICSYIYIPRCLQVVVHEMALAPVTLFRRVVLRFCRSLRHHHYTINVITGTVHENSHKSSPLG